MLLDLPSSLSMILLCNKIPLRIIGLVTGLAKTKLGVRVESMHGVREHLGKGGGTAIAQIAPAKKVKRIAPIAQAKG